MDAICCCIYWTKKKKKRESYSSAHFLPVYTSSSGIFSQLAKVWVLAWVLYTFFSRRSAWPSSLPDGFAFVYTQTSRQQQREGNWVNAWACGGSGKPEMCVRWGETFQEKGVVCIKRGATTQWPECSFRKTGHFSEQELSAVMELSLPQRHVALTRTSCVRAKTVMMDTDRTCNGTDVLLLIYSDNAFTPHPHLRTPANPLCM